jgi:DNA-directed RNA polymerase subunit alpha
MRLSLDETQVTVKTIEEKPGFGIFSIGPLPPGYGHTIGNTLRRCLLSSLRGAALTQVSFEGVPHQFTTIKGVKEDVVELTLNLKQVRLKIEGDQPVVLTLKERGPKEVTAGDIKAPAGVTIANKDLPIATLADKKTKLEAELIAEPGRGYVPSEERSSKVGVIPLDSVFSPVLLVSYRIEPTRVGRASDYDQLQIEITTDRTITPQAALLEAAGILDRFFARISKGEEERPPVNGAEETALVRAKKITVEELDLPVRILNSLKKAGIKRASELLEKGEDGLGTIKNIGPSSARDIRKALKKEDLL